jgi:hypothetical protein
MCVSQFLTIYSFAILTMGTNRHRNRNMSDTDKDMERVRDNDMGRNKDT